MKRRILIYLLLLLTIIGLISYFSLFTAFYGMKEIMPVDEKTIVQYANEYNVPTLDLYELDTMYSSYLKSLDTVKYENQIKNHYQPLQALYYNYSGQLKSFQVNCYAGGFPNLNWERDGIMTTFPPKQQAPVDSILPLGIQLKYLKPLSKTTKFSFEDYDYIVVVYWSRFMGRQSKRLIRIVQENCKMKTGKKVKIIYVNTDNLFSTINNE